jgi:hypothetical protein
MRIDHYLQSVTAMVNQVGETFSPEQLIVHLGNEATRFRTSAAELRFLAASYVGRGLTRQTMEDNATLLEQYARHCETEALRLVDERMPKTAIGGGR